jgi:hypothetical protein
LRFFVDDRRDLFTTAAAAHAGATHATDLVDAPRPLFSVVANLSIRDAKAVADQHWRQPLSLSWIEAVENQYHFARRA